MEIAPRTDLYRQLYEESLAKRQAQREEIMWLKQQAREAARKRRKLTNLGFAVLTLVNIAAWVLAFTIGG